VFLWLAWSISAAALVTNQIVFRGSGVGPGPSLGVLSLLIQAVALVLVGRGDQIARIITLVFVVIAALPTPMLPRLVAERAVFSAGYIGAGFVLKAFGACLLLTPNASAWFARR